MAQPIDGFDAQLKRALAGTRAAGPCPDTETLAAFLDGALDGEARMACETHLATCARCQAILAAAVEPESLADATTIGAAAPETPSGSPARVLAFPWRRLSWAGPLALAASVLFAVWIARSPQPAGAPQPSPGSSADDRPAVPAPEPAARQPSIAKAERDDGGRLERRIASPREEAAAQVAASPRVAPDSAASGHVRLEAMRVPPLDTLASSPLPQSEAPRPARAAGGSAGGKVSTELPSQVSAGVVGGLPAAPPAESPAPVAMAKSNMAGARRESENAGSHFASPSGRVSWQFLDGGVIARSIDGGGLERVAVTGDRLLAGSAVSDTVVWVVGRGGAIWRTTDGQSWQKLPFPTVDDLVSVLASSANTATVTTRDGQRLTTDNAGLTWNKP